MSRLAPTPPVSAVASIALTTQPEPARAIAVLQRLAGELCATPVLLPNPGSKRDVGTRPQLLAEVARQLSRNQAIRIGLPVGTPPRVLARWQRLASTLGGQVVTLGAAGWARVELGERGELLSEVYAPAELDAAHQCIVFAGIAERGPLDTWRRVVHPHSRLRASVGGQRAVLTADLAAAFTARYVLDLAADREAHDLAGLAATDDPIAAELTHHAMRYLRDAAAGVEAPVPWEDAGVQAAVAHGLGVPGGHQLVVRVAVGDNRAQRLAERLAEVLDCRVACEALEG